MLTEEKRGGGKGLEETEGGGALREATGGRAPGALSTPVPTPCPPTTPPCPRPVCVVLVVADADAPLPCVSRARARRWQGREGSAGGFGGLTLGDEPNNKVTVCRASPLRRRRRCVAHGADGLRGRGRCVSGQAAGASRIVLVPKLTKGKMNHSISLYSFSESKQA